MPGGRRKWTQATQGGSFRLHWVDKDSGVFKVEQEGDGLTDAMMEEWGPWMDSQIEKQFKSADHQPELTANTLNFSRNELGDEGVRAVVEYLRKRKIGVQMVKFFKNKIGDGGGWAIGQLLAHSRVPVHEVHLSHNRITENGACSIFEAIARSHRYPFMMDRSGRRDVHGNTPVWLRMEYNCIQWATIEHRFEQQKIRWCTAESRDGWGPKDFSPMVCMHSSYKNQKSDDFSTNGSPRYEERDESAGGSPRDSAGVDNVPMYVFLDATALRRFATPRDRAKERLFTFQGLLNLCNRGHMKVAPISESLHSKNRAEESERVIFVVTDSVLDELASISEYSTQESQQVEWLRRSPDSYLHKCHSYGILEVLETGCHQDLVRLGKFEYRAHELGVSRLALQNLDFAFLWESQISIPGRVLVVTADEGMCTLTSEMGSSDEALRRVVTTHIHHLDRAFAVDRQHGGHRLYEVSQRPGPCSAILSAQIMHSLIVEPMLSQKPPSAAAAFLNSSSAGMDALEQTGQEDAVRQALREAISLISDFQHYVEGSRASAGEVHRFLERTSGAQSRWQGLLDWRPLPVCQ